MNAGNTIRVTEKALARLHDIQDAQAAERGRRVTMAEVIELLLNTWEHEGGNPR